MFKGSIPALVTPFRDEAFDEGVFRAFVDWQIAEGSHALVPCGTTGESATLVAEEHYRVVEVCIDCVEPAVVARFWIELLGYRTDDDLETDGWIHLEPPAGLPVLNLQRVPEAKAGKNRLHLDLYVVEPDGWIERCEQLGATKLRLHDDPKDWFQVMADPAGNEFCVCRENQV